MRLIQSVLATTFIASLKFLRLASLRLILFIGCDSKSRVNYAEYIREIGLFVGHSSIQGWKKSIKAHLIIIIAIATEEQSKKSDVKHELEGTVLRYVDAVIFHEFIQVSENRISNFQGQLLDKRSMYGNV